MSEENKFTETDPEETIDVIQETMESFVETANVNTVYADSILHEGTLIIPAAEVVAALGFGLGYGTGYQMDEEEENENSGSGGGGGGGGKTFSRPVAVIIASKDGVRVEPVVDPTKIAITLFTALGFMVTTIARMKRGK